MPLPALAAVALPALKGIGLSIATDLGSKLASKFLGKAMDAFQSGGLGKLFEGLGQKDNPIRNFAEAKLQDLGLPAKQFLGLANFANNPTKAIENALRNVLGDTFKPVNAQGNHSIAPGGCVKPMPGPVCTLPTDPTSPSSPTPTGGGLSVSESKDGPVVDTGRYLISGKDDDLKIFDKETNTWTRAFGDPHVRTSDGDKAKFHNQPLTIELQDGTKVTIDPTDVNKKGLAWIDSVAITKGDEAVVMTGFHDGKKGVQHDGVKNGWEAAAIDNEFADGTVLRAGNQVDDLYRLNAAGDAIGEVRGSDKGKEWDLDKMGGANSRINLNPADYRPGATGGQMNLDQLIARLKEVLGGGNAPAAPANGNNGGAAPAGEAGGAGGAEEPKGIGDVMAEGADKAEDKIEITGDESLVVLLNKIAAKLAKSLKAKSKEYGKLMDQKTNGGKVSEEKLAELQGQIQELQGLMTSVQQMASNAAKNETDTAKAIARNMA